MAVRKQTLIFLPQIQMLSSRADLGAAIGCCCLFLLYPYEAGALCLAFPDILTPGLIIVDTSAHCIQFDRGCCRTDPGQGGSNDILLPNGPTLVLRGPSPAPHTRFALPTARKRRLSMPEIGEKKRDYLFKKLYRLRVMT